MMNRRNGIALLALLSAAFSGCSDATNPGGGGGSLALKHDPILFVHGYGGNGANWQDMKAKFLADGWLDYELYAYSYSFTASNATGAQEIRNQVTDILRTTGATKVDIVAFSMGSVSSRYYLKNLDGTVSVDAYVSLAGPNHGTDAVENSNCQFTPCKEIIPGSAFLTALNTADETPGLVRYATWRSPCDATINPDESVILTGATNNQSSCIAHIQFLTDAPTYQQVRAFIQ